MGLSGLGVGFGQQVISFRMHQALQVCAGDLSLPWFCRRSSLQPSEKDYLQ